jgi:SNF2 family DNA or RNA helicase
MGLGKTAQSIAVLAWLRQYAKAAGPFLVVAPLTTLGHWQREVETWTDMVRRVVWGVCVGGVGLCVCCVLCALCGVLCVY